MRHIRTGASALRLATPYTHWKHLMTFINRTRSIFSVVAVAMALFVLPSVAAEIPDLLPDPDGQSAD